MPSFHFLPMRLFFGRNTFFFQKRNVVEALHAGILEAKFCVAFTSGHLLQEQGGGQKITGSGFRHSASKQYFFHFGAEVDWKLILSLSVRILWWLVSLEPCKVSLSRHLLRGPANSAIGAYFLSMVNAGPACYSPEVGAGWGILQQRINALAWQSYVTVCWFSLQPRAVCHSLHELDFLILFFTRKRKKNIHSK